MYEEEWLASLPTEEELARMYTFSPRFKRRMARLFAQQKKPYYNYINRPWKKALLAAVISLLFFAASMSVSAIRRPIIRFAIEIYEKFSSLFYSAENEIEQGIDYRPTYLPNGFTLKTEELIGVIAVQRYENVDGGVMLFRHYPWRAYEFQADTESTDLEDVELSGCQGVFYHNKGLGNLIWSVGDYSFWIVASLDKNTMIDIALSVKIVD